MATGMIGYLRGEKRIDLDRKKRCIREDLHFYNKEAKIEDVINNSPDTSDRPGYKKVVRVRA